MLQPPEPAVAQGFPPVAGPEAQILILGSLPGNASLEAREYYAHPRNAFWPIMATLFDFSVSAPYPQRCSALIEARIALWDVCHTAVRAGSLDSNIRKDSVIANPIEDFLHSHTQIKVIACNGRAAYALFKRHIRLCSPPEILQLPSTSPAHAARSSLEKLSHWQRLLPYLTSGRP